MDNEKLINIIFEELEKNHINLFHSIDKEYFNKAKHQVIRNSNSLKPIEFDYEMKKLFALFKDAHTTFGSINQQLQLLDVSFDIIDGKTYIITFDGTNKNIEEVKAINGVKIEEILKRIELITPFETKEWLNH